MDEDEDDLYSGASNQKTETTHNVDIKDEDGEQAMDEEDSDSDEEESDSDIDIITERAPGPAQEPASQERRTETVKKEGKTATQHDEPTQSAILPVVNREAPAKQSTPQKPGYEYPEVHESVIEVNAVPTYEPTGKPITELEFDADLAEHDKPWRRPGMDQADYFNYGFDEFTWATYCLKQKTMRETIESQKAESAQFEQMFTGMPNMMGAQGMPAMPAMPGMAGMPGMPDPAMMEQMMGQMMASGMDPSNMDMGQFMQNFQQPQGQGMPQMQDGGGQRHQGGNYNRGRQNRRW